MQDRKPARQFAPAVTIRFRTKKELETIKRAAKIEGLSLNTFVCGKSALAAQVVLGIVAAPQVTPVHAGN